MTDFGTMQHRIADELSRVGCDLPPQKAIQDAIVSAIAFYQDEDLWFKETQSTISTVNGQDTYVLPNDFETIISLQITVNADNYPMIQRTWEWYVNVVRNVSTFIGLPTDFVIFRDQLYLYPTPNAVYVMCMSYRQVFTALTALTDSNAWMTDGERLIRHRAKYDILINSANKPDMAAIQEREEVKEMARLRSKNVNNVSTGSLRATSF